MQKTTEMSPKNTICSSGIRYCIKHLSSMCYGQDTVQKTTWCPRDSLLSSSPNTVERLELGSSSPSPFTCLHVLWSFHFRVHCSDTPCLCMTNGSESGMSRKFLMSVCLLLWPLNQPSVSIWPVWWAPTSTYFVLNAFVHL